MLGACSGGFSRFEGSGFGLAQNDFGSDKIVTSSLAPIPGEPAYGGEQPSYRPAPTYANASPRSLAPPPSYQTARAAAAGETITVRQGETLYSISERYGVPAERIKTANNLTSANLAAGRTLIIPRSRTSAGPVAQNSSYTVRQGESLATIARRHGLTHQELARHNNLSNPESLQPGQTIQLPAGAKPVALASADRGNAGRRMPLPAVKPNRSAARVASASRRKTGEKPIRVASSSSALELPSRAKASTPKPQRIAHLGKLPKPQPMSASQFRWPVRGRVISGYGTKPNGKHNDGINISVPQGTSVKAAENGVVAYAGSELKGYGNLILIRHSDDWVSAYAHNEELLVQRGEKVRRGQIIAKAGQSGTVRKPQVHFELRKGSRPMNPMKHLAGI
jgi:murein DD-endopeptidase MepM/ murein hydrolase activator NlpD